MEKIKELIKENEKVTIIAKQANSELAEILSRVHLNKEQIKEKDLVIQDLTN